MLVSVLFLIASLSLFACTPAWEISASVCALMLR
jgi:hypothetical protein